MRHVLGVILLFVVGSAQAATVTVDFEELVPDSSSIGPESPGWGHGTTLTQGFSFRGFSATTTQVYGSGSGANNSYAVCLVEEFCTEGYTGAGFDFQNASGQPFALLSMDIWVQVDTCVVISATVDLVASGFATCSSEYQPGTLLVAGGNSVVFASGAMNLSSVSLVTYDNPYYDGSGSPQPGSVMLVDNVVVNVVPIPGAVWLFGSGLGLLGWFRRKKA